MLAAFTSFPMLLGFILAIITAVGSFVTALGVFGAMLEKAGRDLFFYFLLFLGSVALCAFFIASAYWLNHLYDIG